VEAPSVLGLKPTGVDGLPAALLRHGLADRLGARIAARLTPPPYEPDRPPDTGTLNADGIARFSSALADAVGDVIAAGDRPFVLGGDCSILLGSLLAFRRHGRYGLLFVDGHADFYQPEANPNGEAASTASACRDACERHGGEATPVASRVRNHPVGTTNGIRTNR
jgi:arginase